MLRPATAGDLDAVVALCGERAYPALTARGQTPEQRRQAIAAGYRRHWEWVETDPNLTVLVSEREGLSGFLLMITGLRESITDETQAMVYDLYGRHPGEAEELLELAEGRARAASCTYLVMDLAPGEPLEDLFTRRGYAVDINRIVRVVTEVPERARSCRVRSARPNDHLFIVWLNSQTAVHTIPGGRGTDPAFIAQSYFDTYLATDFAGDPALKTFIAEHPTEPRQIGYIVLKLGYADGVDAAPMAYIYDLAVHPDQWGRRVVHDLMLEVDRFLVQEGIRFLQGDISQANQRALKTAVKSLGFQVEWRRWAVAL
ncbi:MAG: GNAT family N-acetyltransferase [Candidatus Eremiobacterota bacterium]